MLYSMLPSVLQSRLPRLPSLRRSASMYGGTRKQRPLDPRPSSKSSTSSASSGIRTPEAGYTSALVLSDTRTLTAEDDLVGYFDGISSDEEASSSKAQQRQGMELTETQSGIGWKFANQGKLNYPYVGNVNILTMYRSQPP